MKKSYSELYYAALFFEKIAAKDSEEKEIAFDAVQLGILILKQLDSLQSKNHNVTYSFATDSLRVYYQGKIEIHIVAKKHSIHLWCPYGFNPTLIKKCFENINLFEIKEQAFVSSYKNSVNWPLTMNAAKWLFEYLDVLWAVEHGMVGEEVFIHSRHIPGSVRQAILSDFLLTGQVCGGVSNIQKPHKLSKEDRIEFDHILPFSLGGSNTVQNVQILCSKCNSIKRATAL